MAFSSSLPVPSINRSATPSRAPVRDSGSAAGSSQRAPRAMEKPTPPYRLFHAAIFLSSSRSASRRGSIASSSQQKTAYRQLSCGRHTASTQPFSRISSSRASAFSRTALRIVPSSPEGGMSIFRASV